MHFPGSDLPMPTPMDPSAMGGFRNKDLLISEKDKRGSRRKKLLALLTMPLLIAVVTLYMIPFLIDWDKQKDNLKNQMLSMTGRELIIDGSIEFKAFPLPSFTIHGVKLSNPPSASTKHIFSVQTMTAHPSVFALLFGRVRIVKLELTDLVIELENFQDSKPNWDFKSNRSVAEVSQGKKTAEEFAGIRHVVITAGKLFFRSGKKAKPQERLIELSNVDINADSFSGPFIIKGGLESSLLNYRFDMVTGNLSDQGADVEVKIAAGTSSFDFKGDITNWNTKPQLQGMLKASLDKSIESMTDYFGIDNTILPSKVSEVFSSKTTDISGALTLNGSGFSLKELAINSISTKGKGEVSSLFGEEHTELLFKLGFEKINLDDVMEEKIAAVVLPGAPVTEGEQAIVPTLGATDATAPAAPPKPEAATQALPEVSQQQLLREEMKSMKQQERNAKFDLASTLKLQLDMTVDEAVFRGQKISGLRVDAEFGQGETLIKTLTAKNLPGNSSIDVSGTLSKEMKDGQEIQKFESVIKASGDELLPLITWLKLPFPEVKEGVLKNFSVEAGVTILPERILVNKISVGVDQTFLLGQALVQKGDNPATTSAFKIKYLNLDKYLLNSLEGKTSFFDQPYKERDVVLEQSKLDAFLRWPSGYLKNFGVSLDIDELVVRGDTFKNLNAVLVMKPSIMEVKKLSFDSFAGKTELNGLISTKSITPYIEANITSDKFDFRYLTDFSSKVLPPQDPKQPIVWSQEDFYLTRLGVANMKVTGKFKDLQIGRLPFKDADVTVSSDGKDMKVETFRGTFMGGIIDAKADIGVDKPNIGLSISINNADFTTALRDIFGFSRAKQGRFSLSLGLSSNGTKEADIVSSLSGSGTITVRGAEFTGVDIGSIVQDSNKHSKIEDLRKFLSYASSNGSTTFDYLASNISVKDGNFLSDGAVATHFAIKNITTNANFSLSDWVYKADTVFMLNVSQDMSISHNAEGSPSDLSSMWITQRFIDEWEKNFYKNY
jgi:uncharacterized protein involved in outer membrane biogenesis